MDTTALRTFVGKQWDDSIIPELVEYVRIPNKSPAFDHEWQAHGYMDQVVARFEAWVRRQSLRGMRVEVMRIEGRTPLILIDIPGSSDLVAAREVPFRSHVASTRSW